MLYVLAQTNDTGFIDFLQRIFLPFYIFFTENGEIGLFFYSIFETITPLAGVEVILFPLLLATPERWALLSLNLVFANTIGATIVYYFMAKEDNRFYNRFVKKENQERSKKLFDRYGVWAIFIFAMTPLPFFVIIFTAAIARMKVGIYLSAVFFSRGVRFFVTSYAVAQLGSGGNVILWLALIGVIAVVILGFIQKRTLKYLEAQAQASSGDKGAV